MPVITLPDGSQGYSYPHRPKRYDAPQDEYVGRIVGTRGDTRRVLIARVGPRPHQGPWRRNESCCAYWAAELMPDGSLGKQTTIRVSYAKVAAAPVWRPERQSHDQ